MIFYAVQSGFRERPETAPSRPRVRVAHAMPHLAALFLVLSLLTGCGESYTLQPARLDVLSPTDETKGELPRVVSSFLMTEGFEDFGIDSVGS